MTELERALVALGRALDVPAAPDVMPAVRPRLAARRRWWPAAVVVLAAALAVALAVPGSRAAMLRFFHIRGAEVKLVDRVPAVRSAPLGERIRARDASFRLLLLDGRAPEAVYRAREGYWLRYPGVLLFEFESGSASVLKKVAGGGTRVTYVDVGREPGIWIGPGAHVVYLPGGEVRRAHATLLWQRGTITLRLEGPLTQAKATKIALRAR